MSRRLAAGAAGSPSAPGLAPRARGRRRWGGALLACIGLLVVASSGARGDRIDDAWKAANDAYLRGDYGAAIAAYEQLERQPVVSADLAFNLGNAYFRKGELGPAIWAWERALTLDPDSDDARYNLEYARKVADQRVKDKLEGADREPGWMRVVNLLSPSAETWLFVALYLAFFAALALFLRARRRGRDDAEDSREAEAAGDPQAPGGSLWAVIAGLLAVAAAGAGTLLAGRLVLDRTPFAIVLPDAAAVKEGADTNYRTTFSVHAGLRVRVLEQDHDWVRVRLANGLEGWLPDRSVGRL
jgi:hypothetical protein